jgi:hypothetical protein
VTDPEQPPTPSWWTPTPGAGSGDTAEDGAGRSPEARSPLPPAPTWTGPPSPPPYTQPYAQPYVQPYGYAPPPTTNSQAVASLVCGIFSVVGGFACFAGAFASIPGLILGIIGLQRINRSNGREKGRGMAVAGIVTSAVGVLVLVALIILFGFALSDPANF